MATLFDSASLVMIPSGYKEDKVYSIKPTDGSGDLAFSRSNDTATRVNSSGLIEKVRTNAITYSQDFSNWSLAAVNVTTSATANPLDGALNAQDITPTATLAVHRILISSGVANSLNSWSVYAKANGYNFISIVENGNTAARVSFNLSTGTVETESIGVGKIESLGNGWYRCSMIHTTASGPRFDIYVSPTDSLNSYTADGTSGVILFGAQAETGDIATDYIATTTAAVSVGPVANLPRLDYSGGASCPKLLLEPQRTNYLFPSENATSWPNGSGNVTANATISPSGYQDADEITDTGDFYKITTLTSSDLVSSTIFVKRKTADYFKMSFGSPITQRVIFNLNTGAVHSTLGSVTGVAGVDYGNGWWRFEIRGYSSGSFAYAQHHSCTSTGTQVSGAYIWGAQMEIGAYGTSYIPTLSAASTRGADAASKTGISSLIGQTEGTMFYEGVYGEEAKEVYLFLQNASSSATDNSIYLQKNISGTALDFNVFFGSTQVCSIQGGTFTKGQAIKIAAAYKANDFVLYVNGVQIGTDSSGAVPTCGFLQLATYRNAPSNPVFSANNVKQALLFKTRLTNAELAALTTI